VCYFIGKNKNFTKQLKKTLKSKLPRIETLPTIAGILVEENSELVETWLLKLLHFQNSSSKTKSEVFEVLTKTELLRPCLQKLLKSNDWRHFVDDTLRYFCFL